MASMEEQISLRIVSQFEAALRQKLGFRYLKKIVDQQGDINFKIPANSYIATQKPELIESTLLHLALRESNHDIFEYLLDRSIDFTIQNRNGSTALLQPIEGTLHEDGSSKTRELKRLVNKLDNPYTDLILSKHVSQNISINPCNTYGISHFHVACLLNKARAVKFFLQNGVPVNGAVSSKSPIFPGFSPLHLSIASHSLETIKILLEYGAEKHPKDSSGTTPLQILVERRLVISQLTTGSEQSLAEDLQRELLMIVEKIWLLLENHDGDIIDETGLSLLHVACILPCTPMRQDIVARIENLNHAINMDSTFLPGYTPLHFAMLSESDLAVPLLSGGADILARAMNGQTPLDILLESSSIDRIHLILSSVAGWNDIFLSDGRTRLLDVISVMRSVDEFDNMIHQHSLDVNSFVPVGSPLFSGWSVIHLAVLFSRGQQTNFDIIESCLRLKANPFASGSNGSSALHLAFRLHKIHTFDLLLQRSIIECFDRTYGRCLMYQNGILTNAAGKDDLSMLHMAVAANNVVLVENLLKHGTYNVNSPVPFTFEWFNKEEEEYRTFSITAGSTSLHIAVATGNIEMLELLLGKGGDIYAEDAYGLTPIHRALVDGNGRAANLLLSIVFKSPNITTGDIQWLLDYQDESGRTVLHLAATYRNFEAVRGLLKSGADINIVNANENSAAFVSSFFWHINKWNTYKEIINLSFHVYKLRHLHLDVIQQNIQFQERTYIETRDYECIYEQRSLRFSKEMHEVESLNVGRTTPIPLRNFLSETGIVAAYPTMPLCQREEIKTFFETELSNCQFQEIDSLLRLQYRKAKKRRDVYEAAKQATQALAKDAAKDSLQIFRQLVPDLCCEIILRCLTNRDVDNLIAATKCSNE